MKIQHITEKHWRADEPKPKKRKPSRKHQQRHPGQTRGMVGEDNEMGGGERVGRLIGRLKHIGLTAGAATIFIKEIRYGLKNPNSDQGEALKNIYKGLTTPANMIGYFATLGVIGVGTVQLYKLQRWLLENFGGLIGKIFDIPSKVRKKSMVGEMGDVEGTDAYKSLERDALLMLKQLHKGYVDTGRVNAFELPELLRQHMPEISKPQSYTFFSKFIDKKLYLDEGDVVDMSTPLPAGFINWLKTKDLTVGVLKDRVKMRKLRLQYEKETGRKVNEYNSLEESVGQSITEAEFDRLAEKKDACYHKVKSRYKVWPSAYASGALVQCRKKGAKNWGNKSKKK